MASVRAYVLSTQNNEMYMTFGNQRKYSLRRHGNKKRMGPIGHSVSWLPVVAVATGLELCVHCLAYNLQWCAVAYSPAKRSGTAVRITAVFLMVDLVSLRGRLGRRYPGCWPLRLGCPAFWCRAQRQPCLPGPWTYRRGILLGRSTGLEVNAGNAMAAVRGVPGSRGKLIVMRQRPIRLGHWICFRDCWKCVRCQPRVEQTSIKHCGVEIRR